MGTITTTDVQNGTATDAGVINANFAAIKTEVNGNLDNSNIDAAAEIAVSKLDASSTDGDVLTTVAGVPTWQAPAGGGGGSTTVPVGAGMDYWGSTAPSGWVFADGSALSRSTYADLFAVMGTTYGSGDGSTTFNLPDKAGRVSVTKGSNSSVDTLGENDGLIVGNRRPQHRHTAHAHSYTAPGGSTAGNPGGGIPAGSTGGTTSSADGGSGVATDPLDGPAYIVCNYIIYTGV